MRLQLTRRTDYAVRACVHLALQERCPVSSRRIAAEMDIPDRFLPQVMSDLARAGIVGAVAGKNGGYCLRRGAAGISIVELVDATEARRRRDRCVMRDVPCDGDPACALHQTLADAEASFVDVFAGASIADLAARHRAARQGDGHRSPERTIR